MAPRDQRQQVTRSSKITKAARVKADAVLPITELANSSVLTGTVAGVCGNGKESRGTRSP